MVILYIVRFCVGIEPRNRCQYPIPIFMLYGSTVRDMLNILLSFSMQRVGCRVTSVCCDFSWFRSLMLDLNRSFCAYESSAGQAVITPADNQRNLKVQYDSILILAIHLSLKKKEVLDVVCKIDDRFIYSSQKLEWPIKIPVLPVLVVLVQVLVVPVLIVHRWSMIIKSK